MTINNLRSALTALALVGAAFTSTFASLLGRPHWGNGAALVRFDLGGGGERLAVSRGAAQASITSLKRVSMRIS